MLSITDLSKKYSSIDGNQTVLNGLNLQLNTCESLAIIGESGSGKSTLLHIIAGLEKPSGGYVKLNGINLWLQSEHERARFRRNHISVIFQQFNLVPSLTVKENIEFHAKLINRFEPKFASTIIEYLKLENILTKYPEQTSGGQQQRVAIARALTAKPNLILADEPTGNLDPENSQRVAEILNLSLKQIETSLIVATHSDLLANTLDSKISLINGVLR